MFRKEFIRFERKVFFLLIVLWVIYQVIQSTVVSDSLTFVVFRGEDDGNFHLDLQKFTKYALEGSWREFFRFQPHGYGWIFWLTSLLVSIPGQLAAYFLKVDSVLIVSLSVMSLAFCLSAIFVFYKTCLLFTSNEVFSRWLSILFLSTSFFSYTSIKWHPSAQNLFFSILGFWYLHSTPRFRVREILTLSLILALAASFRMFSVLLWPAFGVAVLVRLYFIERQRIKKTLGLAALLTIATTLLFVLFSFPNLVICFGKEEFEFWWQAFAHATKVTSNYDLASSNEDIGYRFRTLWFHGYWNMQTSILFLCILTSYFRKVFKEPLFRFEDVTILLLNFSSLMALCFHIFLARGNPGYSINHYFSFFYFCLFFLVHLNLFRSSYIKYITIALFFALNSRELVETSQIYFNNERSSRDVVRTSKEARSAMLYALQSSKKVSLLFDLDVDQFVDFRDSAPTVVKGLGDNYEVICSTEPFDFIILSKNSLLTTSDTAFETHYKKKIDELNLLGRKQESFAQEQIEKSRSGFRISRARIQNLREEHKLCSVPYELFFENQKLLIFRRESYSVSPSSTIGSPN